MKIRRTYKYRLYSSKKRDQHLHQMIDIAGIIWNHITVLQKRYYRLFGKHISEVRMKSHIAKLRMQTTKYRYWKKLGSQAVQDICERHEETYQKFFNRQGGLPRFKKVKKYKSFTLKQRAGWEMLPDKREVRPKASGKGYHRGKGEVTISGRTYKYIKHRPIKGDIKTVTIKRDAAGRCGYVFQ